MIINDNEQIKNFKESIKEIKNKSSKINYIVNNYKENGLEFHKIYLNSGNIHSLSSKDLDFLICQLKSLDLNNLEIIIQDYNCLSALLNASKDKTLHIKQLIKSSNNNITINDLFNYLELVHLNIKVHNKNILNEGEGNYPIEVLYSQFNHTLDSLEEIIGIIKDYNLNNSKNYSSKYNDIYREIYISSAFKSSIDSFIKEVSLSYYKPSQIDNFTHNKINYGTIFNMEHSLEYWRRFEINRDLNNQYYYDSPIDDDLFLQLGLDTSTFEISNNGELFKVDYEKLISLQKDYSILREYNSIAHIYGDISNNFIFNNKHYSIKDLVNVFCSLRSFAQDKLDAMDTNSSLKYKNLITINGIKQLLRNLNLNSSFADLLDLLSFDIDEIPNNKLYRIHYKPLIKKNNLYYILPSWISYKSIDRCIDQILSSEDTVKLLFDINTKKGEMFEKNIEDFFKDSNIDFGRVKKDDTNAIDEIDGMFVIDDYLFLFEAKAFVKPFNFMEMYNKLHNNLLYAQEQLIKRSQVLKEDCNKLNLIESRSNLKIKGKKIVPFILNSNSFFNGYKEFSDGNSASHFPILDFETLKDILTSKTVNTWEYNRSQNTYKCTKKHCATGKDLNDYLYNQYEYLHNYHKVQRQILENEKIIFPIVTPLNIEP